MKYNFKFKVSYYDSEKDSMIEKFCAESFQDNAKFQFYPVDNPPRIYKAIVIDRPIYNILIKDDKINILVEGYQYSQEHGYIKTTTRIQNILEEE